LRFDGFPQNLQKTPSFIFAVRSALGDFHNITDACIIVLIVDGKLCFAPYVFAVLGVLDRPADNDPDGFACAFLEHYAR
jgi:hypothetical protein